MPASADILAISGGGEDGAFGAGLLCGWTEAGTRPEFKLVTGISTGALIAPCAFLGPRYDPVLRDSYTKVTGKDIFRKQNILAVLFDDGMLDSEPLRRMVWSWTTVAAPGKRQLPPMRIECTLSPEAGGTLLELRQTGLEGQPRIYGWMMAMGWGTMLKRWLPKVLAAFERGPEGLVYRRIEKAPNRGHHGTKTVPAGFHK